MKFTQNELMQLGIHIIENIKVDLSNGLNSTEAFLDDGPLRDVIYRVKKEFERVEELIKEITILELGKEN